MLTKERCRCKIESERAKNNTKNGVAPLSASGPLGGRGSLRGSRATTRESGEPTKKGIPGKIRMKSRSSEQSRIHKKSGWRPTAERSGDRKSTRLNSSHVKIS